MDHVYLSYTGDGAERIMREKQRAKSGKNKKKNKA